MQNTGSQPKDIYTVKRENEVSLAKIPGVTGIFTGRKSVGGEKLETLAIVVMVSKKKPLTQIPSDEVVPPEIHGFPTDVIERQEPQRLPNAVDARPSKEKQLGANEGLRRPVVGGCQIAVDLPAVGWGVGTVACLVKDASGNPNILTCQHVVGGAGNQVFQPDNTNSKYMIGACGNAILDYYIDAGIVPIEPYVDFSNYVLKIGSIQGTYNIRPSDVPGYFVQKSGITTGLTHSTVESIDFSPVHGGTIKMYNQILIDDVGGVLFSDHGDSGAAIMNDQYQIVGILWGGANGQNIASPILPILQELNVSVMTDNCPPLYVVHNGVGNAGPSGTCNLAVLSTSWSQDIEINAWNPLGIENSPNLVMFEDRIYNIRQGRGGNDVWCSIYDGSVWSIDNMLAPSTNPENTYGTSYSPSLAQYCGLLYGVHQGTHTNGELWYFTHDKKTWSIDQQISGYQTAYAPAIVPYKGQLYVFTTGPDEDLYYGTYTWSPNGAGVWSSYNKAVPNSNPSGSYRCNNSPSAVAYDGKLYVFYTGVSTDSNVHFLTFDGTTWSDDQVVAPTSAPGQRFSTWDATACFVWNESLFLFAVGLNRSDLYYCTLNNGIWSSAESSGFQTTYGVALGSMPAYRHLEFDIAASANHLYATLEGQPYTLNLANPDSWDKNNPQVPTSSTIITQLDCERSGYDQVLALDQWGNLWAADTSIIVPTFRLDYPSPQPVPFTHISAWNGIPQCGNFIFALAADGTLYAAETPTGGWVQNFPSQQPTKFKQICALGPDPQSPANLLALDQEGNVWSCVVPGGAWVNSALPPLSVPAKSIAAACWLIAMVNGDPLIGTNIYALDEDRNLWGCQIGTCGWTQNFPSQPPNQLEKFFNTCSSLTYAADVQGNYYVLDARTGAWQTNFPAPLAPPPEPES